jgi:hypothetical protein
MTTYRQSYLTTLKKSNDDFKNKGNGQSGIYQLFGFVTTAISYPTVAEYDAFRWGTSIALSVVGLNMGSSQVRGELMGYASIKYYLLPVDKTFKAQFAYSNPGPLARTSLFFGVQAGPAPSYKGKTLDASVANIRPVLGVSYDFGRLKYVSIDVGTLVFKYPNFSSATKDTRLKLAPFLGISVDLDLFNRLRTAFAPAYTQASTVFTP